MHVDTIDSLDDFNQLETDWNTVYSKDPESQLILSWTWFSRIFLDHPDQGRILAVRQDLPGSEYIGFFSIRIKTKWSKSKSYFAMRYKCLELYTGDSIMDLFVTLGMKLK